MTTTKHDLQRIRVNAQGYDSTGTYWGAGPDVFIAICDNGTGEVTVRARNVTEARKKIEAELARTPGAPRTGARDPIGGASPRKTRYEIDWSNAAARMTVRIRITHARDYLGSDHLEIESIKPAKAPLPITETGYRSHFMNALELIAAGGPVTFVTAWLEQDAKGKAWTKAATANTQGDLFQWAAAQGEIGQRQQSPEPRRQDGTPPRRPGQGRKPKPA